MFPQEAIAACTGLDGRERLQLRHTTSERPLRADRQCGSARMHSAWGGGQAPNMGGANQARDDVELFPRTPAYISSRRCVRWRDIPPRRVSSEGQLDSLATSWRSGTDKLPFRLNIDGLESRFPESRGIRRSSASQI